MVADTVQVFKQSGNNRPLLADPLSFYFYTLYYLKRESKPL
jgi:hypothetical protein